MPVALVSLVALAVCNVSVLFHLNMFVEGAIKLLIFLFVYMGWSVFFKPEAYTYTLTLIPERFKFWKRNIE
jgi:hypothetical protein